VELYATLGPASATSRSVRALGEAGADRLRLNASHLDEEGLEAYLKLAQAGGFDPDRVVVDLQGGKTRLAALPASLELEAGDVVRLVPATGELAGSLDPLQLPVDRPAFVEALRQGDAVRIDDGRICLRVLEAGEGHSRLARVEVAGRLEGRKGLALVGRVCRLDSELLDRDRRLLRVALARGVRELALSYASSPVLLESCRTVAREAQQAGGSRGGIRLHAKLEQPWALDHLEELLPLADSFWLCRGDLGAEAGLELLPALQTRALDTIVGRAPLLIAGQLLHHMTVAREPTRSEVCHLADLVCRGVAGFVLSDETATGPHGPAAVGWARRLMDAAS
jgi:pyruvate kinase